MQTRHCAALLALAGAALLAGCASGPAPTAAAKPTTPPTARASAGAMVKLLDAQGRAVGQAVLSTVADGVEIAVSAEGLSPGLHGLHIHAVGRCAPGPDASGKTVAFGAAGPHFDPAGTGRHGHPMDSAARHAGDAPNLPVDEQGRGMLRYVNPMITLTAGPNSVIGRALVVHADPDDYASNPAGNSGARLLCGVIEPARLDAVIGSIGVERHLR